MWLWLVVVLYDQPNTGDSHCKSDFFIRLYRNLNVEKEPAIWRLEKRPGQKEETSTVATTVNALR